MQLVATASSVYENPSKQCLPGFSYTELAVATSCMVCLNHYTQTLPAARMYCGHCWHTAWLTGGSRHAPITHMPKGRLPLRKINNGSDPTGLFSILYYRSPQNRLKILQTLSENWYRKPMRGFNFVPIRSDPKPQYPMLIFLNVNWPLMLFPGTIFSTVYSPRFKVNISVQERGSYLDSQRLLHSDLFRNHCPVIHCLGRFFFSFFLFCIRQNLHQLNHLIIKKHITLQ